MKDFSQRLSSWWFAITVPILTPPTSMEERETIRKRRLFSGFLLPGLAVLFFFIFQELLSGVSTTTVTLYLLECGLMVLALGLNRRGHLKSASVIYFSSTLLLTILVINILSLLIPVLTLVLWAALLILPVEAGLFLPAWGPVLLGIIETVFMIWFVLSERQSLIVRYLQPGDQPEFLAFICFTIIMMATLSAIYAITTRNAVRQADRAAELEQAHQTILEAYKSLEVANAIIQKQALTDALTNLPNHRALVDQLEQDLEHARRYERPFSLLFFDADRFKQINDTYGHAAGDSTLQEIGIRTRRNLRGGDTLGRFGGEEFVVLLPETDCQQAMLIAERIRSEVAASPISSPGLEEGISITLSIGISSYPDDGTSERELLSQADEAMYLAKRLGRNQVQVAQESQQSLQPAG